MNMYLRKLFLLAISCNIASVIFAQEVTKVIPPSPVASAIQRYGDYPVSNFTGIPDIQIPIYTIEAGDIKVPIYLSYHGSGTRVSDLQSQTNYVGLGWTLQTGGVITRTINGLADEDASETNHEGWGDEYQYHYSDMKHVEEGFVDTEYDIYSYNFLGRSGKFIAHPDWKPNQTEWKPFVFNTDGLKFNSSGLGFSMSDEEGRGYYFGGDDAIEFSDYTIYNGIQKSAQSAWYLKSIGSSKHPGTFISYYYQPGPSQVQDNSTGTYILDSWESPSLIYSDFPHSYEGGNNMVYSSSRVYYSTFLPQSIDFPSGTMYFILDASKRLNRIEIFDKQNNLIKTISLQIGSFGMVPKLMSVTFKDATGKQQETYSFKYLDENISNPPWGRDHWGFINGTTFNGMDCVMPISLRSVPMGSVDRNVTWSGVSREPNEYYTKLWTLQRITYPTKGYTEFEFEGNRTDDNLPVGGLRIKSISSYFQDGQLASQKDYTYKNYGHRDVIPSQELYRKSTTYITNEIFESHRMQFSDVPIVDPAPKGSPLTYSKITETEGELTTEYTYYQGPAYEYDYMDFPGYRSGDMYDFRFKKFAHKYKPWNFGQLYSKETSGPGFVNYESYSYDEYLSDTTHDLLFDRVVSIGCADLGPLWPCRGTENAQVHGVLHSSVYNFSKRYFLSGGNRMTSKSTLSWTSDGGQITTGTIYFYDNPAYPTLVTSQTTTNSKGEQIVSELKHATDFPAQAPYALMIEQNRVSPVVKQINSIVKPTGNLFLSSTTTNYVDWGNNLVAPGTIDVEKNGDSYTAIRFGQYDAKGNITEMSKENNPKSSFLWDYNATLPVAECTNATTGQIAYTSFETEEKGNWVFNGMPTNEASAPTGKRAYLLNGSNGISRTVSTIDDYIVSYWTTNANAFSIPGTKAGYPLQGNTVGNWRYFEHHIEGQIQVVIDGSGWIDELRFYPATAQMTTYTYATLIGMTSACDIKNSIKYYEYDAAGRLSVVRDQDKNVLQKICYNYAGQQVDCGATIFYSKAQCRYFKSQTCAVDYLPDSIEYCIPSDKYSSTLSPEAANALAEADLVANGQALANQKAQCHKIYYNNEKNGIFHRTDCLGGVPGPPVPYTVPARKYWSITGPEVVEARALNDLNTNGPLNALKNSQCSSWGNREISGEFYSAVCGEQYKADPYPVFIAENTFISTISKDDANMKAYNEAAWLANAHGTCSFYYNVPVELYNTSGRNYWTITLEKEDGSGENFFFDPNGDPETILGYVSEGVYKVTFESSYYYNYFEFRGCDEYDWGAETMVLEHVTLTPTCNNLNISLD